MSELLTVDQAANFLQVKISTIQNYTKTGKLGFYERENEKLFDQSDLESFRERESLFP